MTAAPPCGRHASAQLEMFVEGVEEAQLAEFLSILGGNGWLTRRQLCQVTGWTERTIRAVAEAAGDQVVRGPKGFTLFGRADAGEVNHCAEIALAQGRKMEAYGLALKRRLHARIG